MALELILQNTGEYLLDYTASHSWMAMIFRATAKKTSKLFNYMF
jgi:hypothetical protein